MSNTRFTRVFENAADLQEWFTAFENDGDWWLDFEFEKNREGNAEFKLPSDSESWFAKFTHVHTSEKCFACGRGNENQGNLYPNGKWNPTYEEMLLAINAGELQVDVYCQFDDIEDDDGDEFDADRLFTAGGYLSSDEGDQ